MAQNLMIENDTEEAVEVVPLCRSIGQRSREHPIIIWAGGERKVQRWLNGKFRVAGYKFYLHPANADSRPILTVLSNEVSDSNVAVLRFADGCYKLYPTATH